MDPIAASAPTAPPADAGGGSTIRTIARAGLVVTLAFAISRVLGYARYVVIGTTFDAGRDLDAFFAAFRIPDFLFQLVAAGAMSSALIPVVSGLVAHREEARAWRVVSTVTTLMLAALGLLALVVLVFADVLVPPIAPGFDAAQTARTVELTRIMLLSPVFLAAGAVATSVLNVRGRFGAAAVAPVVYNLGIILGAVFLAPWMGITGLALGVVAGAAGHLLVQLPALRSTGFRPAIVADLRDPDARRAIRLMVPRAIGLGSTQLVFLVMTSLASLLEPGAISAFTFAFAVLQIPIGVIGVPLGVVLLPSMSREAALGDAEAFRRLLVRGLRLLAYVMVGLAAVGIVVAGDVTRLLFDYGRITDDTIARTGTTLAAFLAGLTAHALIAVLARAFYAHQDTATPVAAALVAVVVDIALALVLVGPLGLTGLALAIAIGAWVELGFLAVLLRRRVPGLGLGAVVGVLAVTTLVAALAAAAAFGLQWLLVTAWGERPGQLLVLLRLVLVVGLGGIVFAAASLALRIGELPTIVGVVVDLIRRRGRP